MDESFILQTVGRLYLENLRYQTMLRELGSKDSEIAELRRQIALLESKTIHESAGTK